MKKKTITAHSKIIKMLKESLQFVELPKLKNTLC